MRLSLSRTEYVAKKIGKLNGEKILDIGCRDMILKKSLEGNFDYTGIDYIENSSDIKNYINHNLENGLPSDLNNYDFIVALDVLEHLENIHGVFKELFAKCDKTLIIALPNIAHYKFRFNFLTKGTLSAKYHFAHNKILDRHRWVPNYKTIDKFVKKNTPNGWEVKCFDYIEERKRNFLFYFIEKSLSKFLPSWIVYERIYFFRKIN